MDFYYILQTILDEKELTIADAAKICNVPDSTLRSIVARKNKTVSLDVAMKISVGLGISLERLNGMKGKERTGIPSNNNALHPAEKKLLEDFRTLNNDGQAYILQTMEMAVTVYADNKNPVKKNA